MTADVDIDAHGNDLIVTRFFKAPRDLLYRAWAEPEHIAKWWGPLDFTASVGMDVRPGGAYRMTMHAPNGSQNGIVGEFVEVDPPSKIVMTMRFDGIPPEFKAALAETYRAVGGRVDDGISPDILMTVIFDAAGEETRLTVRQTLPNAQWRDAFLKLGSVEGWAESFVKLDTLLTVI